MQAKSGGWSQCLALMAVGLIQSAAATQQDNPRLLNPREVAMAVDEATLARQYAIVSAMSTSEVTYSSTGLLRTIKGQTGIDLPQYRKWKVGEKARDLVKKLAPLLLLSGTEELTVERNDLQDTGDRRNVAFNQSIRGIPVFSGSIGFVVNEATGEIESLFSTLIPDRGLPRTPKVTAQQAKERVIAYLEGSEWAEEKSVVIEGQPSLAYYGGATRAEKPTLAWIMTVSYLTREAPPPATPGGVPRTARVLIDAIDGEFLNQFQARAQMSRTVYTANNTWRPIGNFPNGLTRLFGDGQTSSDARGIAAYNNVGKAHEAWYNNFLIEPSAPINIVVHWGAGPAAESGRINGAEWLAFQDGDSSTYLPVGDDLDTVAHEYGHATLRNYVNAVPTANEEAANINEGYADLSAVIADAYHNGLQARPATWEIGNIFRSDPGRGLSSWSFPKSAGTWWVDHYSQRLMGPTADVHYNSTILGLAYYLLSQGGTHPRLGGPSVTPIGHNQAKRVFLTALQNDSQMQLYPTFATVRNATINAAHAIAGSSASQPVAQAWDAVGVTSCVGRSPPAKTSGSIFDFLCRGRYRISWPAVPYATTYHAQRVKAGYPWSLARDIVDGNVDSCSGSVSETTRFRLRACNECGCSEWQDLGTVQFYPQCP